MFDRETLREKTMESRMREMKLKSRVHTAWEDPDSSKEERLMEVEAEFYQTIEIELNPPVSESNYVYLRTYLHIHKIIDDMYLCLFVVSLPKVEDIPVPEPEPPPPPARDPSMGTKKDKGKKGKKKGKK